MSRRPARAPAQRRHHGWVDLIAVTGPWLTGPVLERVMPDGPPRVPSAVRARLRALLADTFDEHGAPRQRLVEAVLGDVLDWADHLRLATDIPDSLAEPVPEHSTVVRPAFAFHAEVDNLTDEEAPGERNDPAEADPAGDDDATAGEEPPSSPASPWRMLGMLGPWGTPPVARSGGDGWAASPAERLATLLRARDVPVGVVTDGGRWWTIVWAPRGQTMATATWDAQLWSEEPETLDAFVALLTRSRFLAVPAPDILPALLAESLDRQEEITETLGRQVRQAVELLVGTFDTLDAETGRTLLTGVSDDDLYDGAVSVMMRLVFLLFAEERRLLPSDDATYLASYSVGRLVDTLEERAALTGEAALEHRTSAWHRLLALSRAVHAGVAHEDLRLPAYGGSLFDPHRHPWLEGRRPGEPPAALPPRVDDRTVLRMLRAVQFVDVAGERRRLTFRSLDVEQIGYVYEGLLELEIRTAERPTALLAAPTAKKPKAPGEVPIDEWAAVLDEGTDAEQVDWLAERTGWSVKRARTCLDATLDPSDTARLVAACGGDADLADLLTPLFGALRPRPDGRPAVVMPGGRYLAPSRRRAATGTHYTPRSLAEDIAGNTLEPLVYRPGPLETADRTGWQLRPSSELLALRIADIAMGSGAFLVAACRYLGDRVVEAWQAEGRADATRAVLSRAGRSHASDAEVEPVLLEARRLVAEHCCYGVDINPLAVEMAKLSLWLITMDRERPFGFLDDRLRCGDSLLGLATTEQLEYLHMAPVGTHQMHAATPRIRPLLAQAAGIRRRITAQSVKSARDVEHKASLLTEADNLTGDLAVIADAVTATGLVAAGRSAADRRTAFTLLADRVDTAVAANDLTTLAREADADLQRGRPDGASLRRPLHWPLAFPEVFADNPDPGFDAIVGNPPFLGGKKISGPLGGDYRAWLQAWDGRGTKGNADLVASFLLRANRLLGRRGQLGYIAVNTLVQGDTLEVGLLQVIGSDMALRRGRRSHKWPSKTANLEIVQVWATRGVPSDDASCWLDGEDVPRIGPDLEPVGNVVGRPHRLLENEGVAFIGSLVLGLGFTLTHEQAADMTRRNPRYAEVVMPYITGKDLNSRPDCSAGRWIINFGDRSLESCSEYAEPLATLHKLVKPERDRLPDYKRRIRDSWWKYEYQAASLYRLTSEMEHVLALARVSSTVVPVRLPTGPVFNEKCVLFVLDDLATLALLSSSVHTTWTVRYTSTLRNDINYAPSDVFLTFPRPQLPPLLQGLGQRLDSERRQLMLGRSWGLTTTYNHVHDPADRDPDVANLRDIHAAIDRAVFDAYGWTDLDTEIGHHRTKIGVRWTISPTIRFEVLDRLLAENHRRHAIETGRRPG